MATGQVLFQRFFYTKSFVKHSMEVRSCPCVSVERKLVSCFASLLRGTSHLPSLSSELHTWGMGSPCTVEWVLPNVLFRGCSSLLLVPLESHWRPIVIGTNICVLRCLHFSMCQWPVFTWPLK